MLLQDRIRLDSTEPTVINAKGHSLIHGCALFVWCYDTETVDPSLGSGLVEIALVRQFRFLLMIPFFQHVFKQLMAQADLFLELTR